MTLLIQTFHWIWILHLNLNVFYILQLLDGFSFIALDEHFVCERIIRKTIIFIAICFHICELLLKFSGVFKKKKRKNSKRTVPIISLLFLLNKLLFVPLFFLNTIHVGSFIHLSLAFLCVLYTSKTKEFLISFMHKQLDFIHKSNQFLFV
jgi:hypothetical protein